MCVIYYSVCTRCLDDWQVGNMCEKGVFWYKFEYKRGRINVISGHSLLYVNIKVLAFGVIRVLQFGPIVYALRAVCSFNKKFNFSFSHRSTVLLTKLNAIVLMQMRRIEIDWFYWTFDWQLEQKFAYLIGWIEVPSLPLHKWNVQVTT